MDIQIQLPDKEKYKGYLQYLLRFMVVSKQGINRVVAFAIPFLILPYFLAKEDRELQFWIFEISATNFLIILFLGAVLGFPLVKTAHDWKTSYIFYTHQGIVKVKRTIWPAFERTFKASEVSGIYNDSFWKEFLIVVGHGFSKVIYRLEYREELKGILEDTLCKHNSNLKINQIDNYFALFNMKNK